MFVPEHDVALDRARFCHVASCTAAMACDRRARLMFWVRGSGMHSDFDRPLPGRCACRAVRFVMTGAPLFVQWYHCRWCLARRRALLQ